EECACCARSQGSGESNRETAAYGRDRTQNCYDRRRNARALLHYQSPAPALITARRTSSTGGRPISCDPGYKRQLKAKPFDSAVVPATSRPLIRIVGEPEN